jgi:pre-mRNA-processing factor 6
LGQVLEYKQDYTQARQTYLDGLDRKQSVKIWLALSRIEERLTPSKVTARAVLANARGRFPQSPELWLASIRLEKQADEPDSVIDSYLARGLTSM